ncbi:hypothetical protein, partial [Sinorhizobium meliloti]|uniref:hypothetical protein n=1 Tax=Rhizobium meliloti TaxID=382 RepID=UPI001AECFF06
MQVGEAISAKASRHAAVVSGTSILITSWLADPGGARQAPRQIAEKIAMRGGVRASPEHRERFEPARDDRLAQLQFFGCHGQA